MASPIEIDLPENVRNALERHGDRIPTLPHAAAEATRLASDPDVSLKKLSGVIESDPALAAEVLRLANSSFYNVTATGGCPNILRALTILGVREVQRICLSVGVFRAFSPSEQGPSLDREKFWIHSASCGIAARRLVHELGLRTDGEEFSAGILHDIGKLVLDLVLHDDYCAAIRINEETGQSMASAEYGIFGTDHAEVSAWLCQRWHLPWLVDALRHHHAPERAQENPQLAALVHVADLVARVSGHGFGGETTPIVLEELGAWRILTEGRDDVDATYVLFRLQDEMERSRHLLTRS